MDSGTSLIKQSIEQRYSQNPTRVINRYFSLAEYGSSWTKMERFLFIESYNVIKDFFMSSSGEHITAFNGDSITIKYPIALLDRKLFDIKNRSIQLATASDGLMRKTIKVMETNQGGGVSFEFTNMFTRISYDAKNDKEHLLLKIPSEVFNEMIPIKSYAQLDLALIGLFNSGSTIRLYEIFKSYCFRRHITLTFTELRKNLGFFKEGSWPVWKYFNAQVLKPAVSEINKHKANDIEVSYSKQRGTENVEFTIIQHRKRMPEKTTLLTLEDVINAEKRELNLIQNKYIDTVVSTLNTKFKISNPAELKQWFISDLISQQQKQGSEFNWKHSCNAMAKQVAHDKYTEPFSHKFLKTNITTKEEGEE